MTQENFLRLNIISEEQIDLTDLEKEINWLTPNECSVYFFIFPSYQDVEVPKTSKNYGIGGGNVPPQFLITYLNDPAIIITLIGALTTIIIKLIEKHKDCEISVRVDNRSYTIKGASKLDKEEIFNKLFPELQTKNSKPAPSKLKEFDPEATLKINSDSDVGSPKEEPPGEWFSLGK